MASSKKSNRSLVCVLRQHLETHLPDGGIVTIALSGGVDSSSLLHAAVSLQGIWQICACHVNHGISLSANRWEDFNHQLCEQYNVPLFVHREKPDGSATEDWARGVRLRAYSKLSADAILLAHHADDQSETVLFRLLRGSGVHGMASIRERSSLMGKVILRPWLMQKRQWIIDYARAHRLKWVEDEDNGNLSRRRNFLRWRALPVLAEEFPSCRSILAASGERIQEGSEMLLQLAAIDEENAREADGGLSIDYFHGVGEARTRNWLYRALFVRRLRFSERHIAEVARQIIQVKHRQGLHFHFQHVALRAWRGCLYWDKKRPSAPLDYNLSISIKNLKDPLTALGGRLIFIEKTGQGLSLNKTGNALFLRPRRGGERLTPLGRPSRRVANLLQESEVYPWRRQQFPLLYVGDELVAVPGIAISAAYSAHENERGVDCCFEWND